MSVRVHRSERSRHLVLRATAGDMLPDSILAKLSEERVACGWIRASGVLADVELRAFDPHLGGLGAARRIAGPVHVLALEGSIGLVDGLPGVSFRALRAREGDHGLETLAGDIAAARVVALEVLVTVLDDLSLGRALDDAAGVWLLDSSVATAPPGQAAQGATSSGGRNWATAVDASARPDREPPLLSRSATAPTPATAQFTTVQIPQRPVRLIVEPEIAALVPEAGDVVDHFAFGRCDVVRSENDRLHLRVHKDGRIREIALEMLRVTRLEGEPGARHFKLERRI
jgi:predicted DNA-binding protein with PD1-like motif